MRRYWLGKGFKKKGGLQQPKAKTRCNGLLLAVLTDLHFILLLNALTSLWGLPRSHAHLLRIIPAVLDLGYAHCPLFPPFSRLGSESISEGSILCARRLILRPEHNATKPLTLRHFY